MTRQSARLCSRFTDPNLALVLLVLGGTGDLSGIPFSRFDPTRVAGAILVLLGLAAIALLPVNWLGAALMVLAFVLLVLEAKITSHGILGAGGAVAMVLGALMLIDSPAPEIQTHSRQWGSSRPWRILGCDFQHARPGWSTGPSHGCRRKVGVGFSTYQLP